MRRIIAAIIAILGIFALVLGIVFIFQSDSAKEQIADEIQPVTLSEVNAKYDAVKAKQLQLRQAEEPQIQAGKAAASDTYNYLSIQRTSLGLAKANIGMAQFIQITGIVNLVIGLGLILVAITLFARSPAVVKT
jgi:predicted PurR-regulated permease PerM